MRSTRLYRTNEESVAGGFLVVCFFFLHVNYLVQVVEYIGIDSWWFFCNNGWRKGGGEGGAHGWHVFTSLHGMDLGVEEIERNDDEANS